MMEQEVVLQVRSSVDYWDPYGRSGTMGLCNRIRVRRTHPNDDLRPNLEELKRSIGKFLLALIGPGGSVNVPAIQILNIEEVNDEHIRTEKEAL